MTLSITSHSEATTMSRQEARQEMLPSTARHAVWWLSEDGQSDMCVGGAATKAEALAGARKFCHRQDITTGELRILAII